MTVQLRSTANCVNTPRVRFVLEELGTPYQITIVPDGTFTAAYGVPGPELIEAAYSGDFRLIEISAIVRHVARTYGAGRLWPEDLHGQAEVDRWLDFQAIRVARAAASGDTATLTTLCGALDRHLAARPWLLARGFTLADCGFMPAVLKRDKLPLAAFPAVTAYFDRLMARPAWARAVS